MDGRWIDRLMDRWVYRLIDGLLDRWIDKWFRDVWIDGLTLVGWMVLPVSQVSTSFGSTN